MTDEPLLRATYLDDAVMHDGKPAMRSAIFLSTVVTGDPVSVYVCYLPLPPSPPELWPDADPDDTMTIREW